MSFNFTSELTTKQKKNMDTTNLNIDPTSGEKSEKTERTKKAAGKAAQLAGAAGLGVAGTMAANAINKDVDDNTEESSTASPVTPDATSSEEVTAEAVTDFDPNDIMIEADEVVAVDDDNIETVEPETTIETSSVDVALVEPQPITGENIVPTEAGEVLIAQTDPTDEPYMNIEPDMYGGPGDWEDFDHDDLLDEDDTFLADNDDLNDDLDVSDDILS